jgi:hypothetical protein
MLFSDLLESKAKIIAPEFMKLFKDAMDNQTHDGDLLLIEVNGSYDPEVYKWTNFPNENPYRIGSGHEGHADFCHYKFINDYRTNNISPIPYTDYIKKFDFSAERLNEIRALEDLESLTIQSEMLVYLKIWEADLFIKKMYQIANLVNGLEYDWHFRIKSYNRDNQPATGTRENIIRNQIRDRLKVIYPGIGDAIANAYKTQIRNAIAHSTYYMNGRYIHLTNHNEEDPYSQIKVLSFDEWNSLFHDTMVIYNQLIGFSNWISNLYSAIAKENNLLVQIRVSRKHPEERVVYSMLKYRPEFNDWGPDR